MCKNCTFRGKTAVHWDSTLKGTPLYLKVVVALFFFMTVSELQKYKTNKVCNFTICPLKPCFPGGPSGPCRKGTESKTVTNYFPLQQPNQIILHSVWSKPKPKPSILETFWDKTSMHTISSIVRLIKMLCWQFRCVSYVVLFCGRENAVHASMEEVKYFILKNSIALLRRFQQTPFTSFWSYWHLTRIQLQTITKLNVSRSQY